MKSLLIGCGHSREMRLKFEDKQDFGELVTLDMYPDCNPDVIFDMGRLSTGDKLPFPDQHFDHLAAYDTLEHWGAQGDWRGYFREFAEYHRILKPGGTFGIIVPIYEDAIADPGHTRFFHENSFLFLVQENYERAKQQGIPMTDYRFFWKENFEIRMMQRVENHHLAVILRRPA